MKMEDAEGNDLIMDSLANLNEDINLMREEEQPFKYQF